MEEVDAKYAREAMPRGAVMTAGGMRERLLAYLSHCSDARPDFDRLVKRARRDMIWRAPTTGASMSLHGQASIDITTAIARILGSIDYVGAARRLRAAD